MRIFDQHHSSSRQQRPLQIALIGSGLTSNCIAIGLQRSPNHKVTIYEGKDHFSDEDGQNFGLGVKALEALSLIHPALREALTRAGATPIRGIKVSLATGPDAGAVISDKVVPDGLATAVRRGFFVKEIRALIEDDSISRLGKKVVKIKDTMGINHPVYELHFSDGTSAYADAVIGGDGVNSFTRTYVLGASDPTAAPRRTNTVSIRRLFDRQRMIEVFGEEWCTYPGTQMSMGDGGLVFMSWSDHWQTAEIAVEFLRAGWPYSDDVAWHSWDREWLRRDMEPYGWIGTRVLELFPAHEPLEANTRKIHVAATTWVKGGVCIAGDAAGAMQPHGGSGANQSIQDALALITVLRTASTPDEVNNALRIYEFWRKALREAAAVRSEDQAETLSGLSPMGTDLVKLRKWLDSGAGRISGKAEISSSQTAQSLLSLF